MKIATSWSTHSDAVTATSEACERLLERLAGPPDVLFVHCSATYDCAAVVQRLNQMAPGARIHGGTSCLGVMTDEGLHCHDESGLGLLGLSDPEGCYGVGAASLSDNPADATTVALEQALERADMPGATPALVWITSPPGNEERVIESIAALVGPEVPVVGGSSADNDVSGQWRQFCGSDVYEDAVVITVLFPTAEVQFAFHSGYEPSDYTGRVTRAGDRVIHEIDDRPAVDVYREWIGDDDAAAALDTPGNVLMHTTLHPLGRVVGDVAGVCEYRLSHPNEVHKDGGLSLFTDISVGDQVTLMRGTHESLVDRAGRVAQAALDTPREGENELAGALVIFCAGCMLTVRDRMDTVAAGLRSALNDKPFLGAFTFGEQGCFVGGENRHGNLMISVLAFRTRDEK